jgi:hypothetical protein
MNNSLEENFPEEEQYLDILYKRKEKSDWNPQKIVQWIQRLLDPFEILNKKSQEAPQQIKVGKN